MKSHFHFFFKNRNVIIATVARIQPVLAYVCKKIGIIKQRIIKTVVVPDTAKLGFELMILSHIKDNDLSGDAIKYIVEKNPHLVFLVGGGREVIGLSFFKRHYQYKK